MTLASSGTNDERSEPDDQRHLPLPPPQHHRQISADCFRLVSLKREVQNDQEVVKPVLEELEVMRLSCALGMLSSVNPKDFEYNLLEAREFDEDFARFLRNELFSRQASGGGGGYAPNEADGSGIRIMSVFGKQAEVKEELKRWGCWSDDCETKLQSFNQGIYCVYLNQVDSAAMTPEKSVLVLFAWLQDILFESEYLRDTPTYVLRFLTSLSPDITCTLSQQDVQQIEQVAAHLSMSQFDEWKSFSVAFRVEKQQDEQDEVRVNHVKTIDISDVPSGGERFLVKGSYAGLATIRPTPAKTLSERRQYTFFEFAELCELVMTQSKTHQLHLEFNEPLTQPQREALLRAAGKMPTEQIRQIEQDSEQEKKYAEEMSKIEASTIVQKYRSQLERITDTLFSVDIAAKQDEGKAAHDTLKDFFSKMKQDAEFWNLVNESTKIVLNLPIRLKNQMTDIYDFYCGNSEKELNDGLEKLVNTRGKTFGKEPEGEPAYKKLSNAVGRAGRALVQSIFSSSQMKIADIPDDFREKMEVPLSIMKHVWWEAVEATIEAFGARLSHKWTDERVLSLVFDCENDQRNAVLEAYQQLLHEWAHNPALPLRASLNARSRYSTIYCDTEEQYREPPTNQLEILSLDPQSTKSSVSQGLRSAGVVSLPASIKVVGVFTIQKQSVLLVTTSSSGTRVSRIQFPLPDHYLVPPSGKVFHIRAFGKVASSCDFDLAQRTIALVNAADSIVLYKFNEQFTSMEMIRTVDLGVRTSLTPPLADLLLLDNAVFLRDHTMACQSVNLRSQQTSKRTELASLDKNNDAWHSGMFALSDGLVLGCLFAKKDATSPDAENPHIGEVVAISSEDHRKIPVKLESDITLLSKEGVSAQCVGNLLFILDPVVGCIQVLRVDATVRSDSYRIQHSKEHDTGAEGEREHKNTEHWLWAFYHVYEKFPVQGMIYGHMAGSIMEKALRVKLVCPASTPSIFERMCSQYLQSVMTSLQKLNKPLGVMDLARDMSLVAPSPVKSAHDFEKQVDSEEFNAIRVQSVRAFLQDLITFIPVQICRAENNTLTVMSDGQDKSGSASSSTHKQQQTFEIAHSIRFGLLSPILESWRGRCVVITSMGKQSTGKSYYLNHLTGSSFAIAGARCTDGAWMTVRMLPKDVLLVVLDFEGLGSFERTEQEDVFLSVLNAAISMFTVFRMEMRFDKEVDDIFSKFQKGIQLIKNGPKLFRGKLYMSVKDVNPNDQRGVLDEFIVKFQKLLGENKDHNFLSDLYSGQLDINCSPPLGTSGYYHSLMHAQQYIERCLCSDPSTGFANGKQFLDCMRLLLAKISILDWTSLDESNQKMQLTEIRYRLPGLLRTGCLIPLEHASDAGTIQAYLKEDIDVAQKKIVVQLEQMLVKFPDLAEKWLLLDESLPLDSIRDEDIDLGFDICKLEEGNIAGIGASLLRLFEVFLEHSAATSSNGKLVKETQTNFDVFLTFVVSRRKLRILAWVTSILGDRLPEEWKSVESQFLTRFQLIYRRCPQKCQNCQLGCMLSVVHNAAEHDCGLGHQCKARCEYCEASDRPGKTSFCAKQAGHEGMCECADGDHTCSKVCSLSSAPNCGKTCSEKAGHAGAHHCAVQIHRCGEPCCAKDCLGRCILSVEVPHTAHKCEEVRCIEKCLMDGCTELCGVMDHFHGQTDVAVAYSLENPSEKCGEVFDAASAAPATHMCSKAHVCQANCSEKGNCYVEVFHKESTKTFSGARGTFQYKYQEMNGFRKKCAQVLLPGQQTHQGVHTCIHEEEEDVNMVDSGRTIHYCEYRCPSCSYFCRKEFGHFGMHATSHGNMRNTYFLADTEEIDLDERQYKTGELGIAEMCNLFCSKMGREHVHYLDCEQGSADTCVHVGDSKDQRRHCTRELVPKPEKEIDEVLHDQFWKTLGWEDPCTSATERVEFSKCSYACGAPSHEENPTHCVLPAWHKPEGKPSGSGDGEFSYVGGHKFKCSHVTETQNMHHVFVLDCSGSMVGKPWTQLMAAWRGYTHNRVAQGALADLISVVTFNETGLIAYEAEDISVMLEANVHFRGGRTSYGAGLRVANEVLSRSDHAKYKPVLVFLSDGHPCDSDFTNLARHFDECYARYDLKVFAVGFGKVYLEMLQYVAAQMGGEYLAAITGNELKETFYSISASLGSRVGLALSKPSHECMCPICQRDMASEEFVQMQPCLHEIHAKCWKELVAMTSDGSKTTCPICRKEVSL